MEDALDISIVMPCLNEVKTLAICIEKAKKFIIENNISGEIIIADNGSTDGSIDIAKRSEVILVNVDKKGHGYALNAGISKANGKYVIIGDSDNSYDFSNLLPFMDALNDGYDFVIGNRYMGGIQKGATPLIHKYIGVPFLSFVNRLLFKNNIKDIHGGLRAFKKSSFEKIIIESRDMTYCTEMVIRASIAGLKLTEVPTTLSPTTKGRKAHLNTWKDGFACLQVTLNLWIKERKKRKL